MQIIFHFRGHPNCNIFPHWGQWDFINPRWRTEVSRKASLFQRKTRGNIQLGQWHICERNWTNWWSHGQERIQTLDVHKLSSAVKTFFADNPHTHRDFNVRNQVVMKRAPSITSAEMRAQVMKAEVEQVHTINKKNNIADSAQTEYYSTFHC